MSSLEEFVRYQYSSVFQAPARGWVLQVVRDDSPLGYSVESAPVVAAAIATRELWSRRRSPPLEALDCLDPSPEELSRCGYRLVGTSQQIIAVVMADVGGESLASGDGTSAEPQFEPDLSRLCDDYLTVWCNWPAEDDEAHLAASRLALIAMAKAKDDGAR